MKHKFGSMGRVAIALVLALSLSLVMAVPVSADDGSGTCTVTPTEVVAGSTGNELTFTFTAAEEMNLGEITIEAPAGWTAPQGIGGVAGYTTATSDGTIGTLTFLAQVITVPITTLASTETITVVYGDGGGVPGATAQTTAGPAEFVTMSKLSAGTLVEIGTNPLVTVNPGLIDHYTVTEIADPQVVGTGFEVTIQAEDANNNDITSGPDAAENIAITFTPASVGSTPTITNTTAGTATVNMTMTVAQTGQTITFTGASGKFGDSNSFDVGPATIDHYTVSTIVTPQVAGTGFSVTIQAQDANDNDITTDVSDETVNITFGLADAGATPTTETTVNGTVTIAAMTMTVAQAEQTITFTGVSGKFGTSNSFDINPGAIEHYTVTAVADPQVTDMAFEVIIQAQDVNDNDITTGTESVTITVGKTDAGLASTPASPFDTTDGAATVSITLTVAQEGQTIIFTSPSGSGTTDSFTVNHPGAIHHYSVTEITDSQVAGIGFAVTIQAQDADNNDIVTGSETITISFGVADAGATPVTATTVNGTIEVGAMTMTVAQTGQTIIFTGDVSAAEGTSNSFDINPGAIEHYWVEAVATTQLAGTAFDVTIQAQDADNNDITTDVSDETVDITVGQADAGLDPLTTATTDGAATVSITLTVAQEGQTIIFTGDPSTAEGTSNSFDVEAPGAIDHYTVTAISPQDTGETFSVTIQAQDVDNNNIVSGAEAAEDITISFGLADDPATPDTTATVDGTIEVTNMTMTVAQTGQTIIFTGDTSGKFGTSNSFTVYDEIRALTEVWTLISTSLWINSTDSAWLDEPLLQYKAAGSVFSTEVTLADLKPVEALYVKMSSAGGELGIIYSTDVQGISAKELVAGWNLISSASSVADNAQDVLSELQDVAKAGTGLTTLVNQHAYNQNSVADFYVDAGTWSNLELIDLHASDGYWISMNAEKTFAVVPQP